MLLKSLVMINFRQFKGKQIINFSTDKEYNVTVVLGNNTSGKTTLLQAFNWCLYGVAVFDTKDILLNLDIYHEMNIGDTEVVEVELCLMHNNTEYIITRTQEYYCESKGVKPGQSKVRVSYKQSDGQIENIRPAYIDNTINEILPKDLSNYFFFDTERISNISNKQDVTEAVKGLLGLTVLENAKKHLGPNLKNSVIGKLKSSMDLGDNKKANDTLSRLESEQERKQVIEKQLNNVESEIDHYEKRKEELETILRDNKLTAELQRKKENIEKNIEKESDYLKKIQEEFIEYFNTDTTNFFAQPLMGQALRLLKEAKIDDIGIKDMTANSIMDIIKRGRCLCGAEIVEGNQAYNNLLQELEYLPPKSIGVMISNFKNRMEAYSSTNKKYINNLKSRYQEIFRYKNRIQEWKDEVEDISTKIKGKENMYRYEEELVDVKKRLIEFNTKKEELIREDEGCRREIDRLKKQYEKQAAASQKNKQIITYIKYAEEIYSWIEKNYKKNENEIREKLEVRVNDIFSKMYHGKRKVVIDNKYRVTLLTAYEENDIKTDESKGLETVKNFAFIAGLVDLAREKLLRKEGSDCLELNSESYPLVMDAPFSNADEKHVCNISKILPQVAQQVIMFVMEKDWKFAEKVMNTSVGKKYFLDKKSEILTYVRECAK